LPWFAEAASNRTVLFELSVDTSSCRITAHNVTSGTCHLMWVLVPLCRFILPLVLEIDSSVHRIVWRNLDTPIQKNSPISRNHLQLMLLNSVGLKLFKYRLKVTSWYRKFTGSSSSRLCRTVDKLWATVCSYLQSSQTLKPLFFKSETQKPFLSFFKPFIVVMNGLLCL